MEEIKNIGDRNKTKQEDKEERREWLNLFVH